jgi:hypothetical protein
VIQSWSIAISSANSNSISHRQPGRRRNWQTIGFFLAAVPQSPADAPAQSTACQLTYTPGHSHCCLQTVYLAGAHTGYRRVTMRRWPQCKMPSAVLPTRSEFSPGNARQVQRHWAMRLWAKITLINWVPAWISRLCLMGRVISQVMNRLVHEPLYPVNIYRSLQRVFNRHNTLRSPRFHSTARWPRQY